MYGFCKNNTFIQDHWRRAVMVFMKKKIFVILLLIFPCVMQADTVSVSFLSIKEIKKRNSPAKTTLVAYDVTGGLWVKDQPLLINQNFDFTIAMSLKNIGPAIAAGKRKKGNKKIVAALTDMPRLQLQKMFLKHIESLAANKHKELFAGHIALYGILYGQPKAQLRVVMELWSNKKTRKNKQSPLRYMYVSDWFPVKDKDSWCASNGKKIRQTFFKAIPVLIKMRQEYRPTKMKMENMRNISIRGGASIQRMSGWILKKGNKMVFVQSKNMFKTIIGYPAHRTTVSNLPNKR